MNRSKIAAAHREEGKPTKMARVEGMIDERYPKFNRTIWIEGGKRGLCLRRNSMEIVVEADTWLEVFDTMDVKIKEHNRKW